MEIRLAKQKQGYSVSVLEAGNWLGPASKAEDIYGCYKVAGYDALNLTKADLQNSSGARWLASSGAKVLGLFPSLRSKFCPTSSIYITSCGSESGPKVGTYPSQAQLLVNIGESSQAVALNKTGLIPTISLVPGARQIDSLPFQVNSDEVLDFPQKHEILIIELNGSRITASKVVVSLAQSKDSDVEQLLNGQIAAEVIVFKNRQFGAGADSNLAIEPAIRCRACHESIYQSWLKTPHAKAYQTLVKKNETTPQCIVCHSTAFRNAKVPSQLPISEVAESVSCATCHGDGIVHVATSRKCSITRIPSASVCVTCHTEKVSRGFKFEKMIKKVSHGSLHP